MSQLPDPSPVNAQADVVVVVGREPKALSDVTTTTR